MTVRNARCNNEDSTILVLCISLFVAFVGVVRICKSFTMHKMNNMKRVSHFDSFDIWMVSVSWRVLSITCFLSLFSYTIMTCYNYCNSYALLSYLEYPIILVQEIILIFLVLKYVALLGTKSFACFGLYIAITGAFLCGLLPKTVLAVLAVSTIMYLVFYDHDCFKFSGEICPVVNFSLIIWKFFR